MDILVNIDRIFYCKGYFVIKMWEVVMLLFINIWKILIDCCRLCGMLVFCVSYIGCGRFVLYILRKIL